MKTHNCLLVLHFLLLCLFNQTTKAQSIIIKGKIPIYISPGESAPVRRAAEDLQRDLYTVLGQPSAFVTKLPQKGPVIVIATGDHYKKDNRLIKGWEAHQIYTNKERIILNGADMRGTIYAIYSFSELILGVKPLWFWASEPPVHNNQITMAANYKKVFNSPDIKYRAWLPNDTDFLTPWQKLSDSNYQALFEAMLRLKLNTLEGVITGKESFIPPYSPGKDATTGQQRGLITTGHHLNIFGSTYAFWEDYWKEVRHLPAPELTIANRQALKEFWGYHIDLAKRNNLEVIWLVGFRGNHDIPFWEFFPDAPKDDKSRAKVIEEMVQMQIDLLKEKTGDPHPPMRLTLYNEMSNLTAAGLFHIPDEPSLIINFVAARRDHFPALDVRNYTFSGKPVGYYLNFQFTSTGSHLAQAEGPRKMEQNYRIVDSLSGHKLLFSVVNAGNIREHLVELSANAEMMWNFKSFNPTSFLSTFSNNYYGSQYGAAISQLYQDFFNSYWQQKKGDLPRFERQYLFQDLRYARAIEMLLNDLEKGKYSINPLDNHPLDDPSKGSVGYFRVIPADNDAANQLEAMAKGTASSIAKLEKITTKSDQIYNKLEIGKVFFDDNLRGQAYLMLHLNRSLNYLVQAYQSKEDKEKKRDFVKQTLNEIHLAQERLNTSNHAPFTDWYTNDAKFGMNLLEKRLSNLYNELLK